MQDNERTNVLAALQLAEMKDRPPLETMFEDVYDVKTPHLLVRLAYLFIIWVCSVSVRRNSFVLAVMHQEQEREMLEHVAKYPEYYTEEY